MPHAASTGQSITDCNGGGVLVAPCNNLGSSVSRPLFNASSDCVLKRGTIALRQTRLQDSTAFSFCYGRLIGSPGFEPGWVSPTAFKAVASANSAMSLPASYAFLTIFFLGFSLLPFSTAARLAFSCSGVSSICCSCSLDALSASIRS
jgi:hypothetical protein